MPRRKKIASSPPKQLCLTISDVSAMLRLGRTKVYDLIKREGLPTVKFGTATRVPVEQFERWCQQRTSA
jgi:excisionase family DNA binding protein